MQQHKKHSVSGKSEGTCSNVHAGCGRGGRKKKTFGKKTNNEESMTPYELDSRAKKSRRVQEKDAEAEQVTQACCNGFLERFTQTEALKVQTDTFF